MSSFKKNKPISSITNEGNKIISKSEDSKNYKKFETVKEITVPCNQEMFDLIEYLFNHFDGDISRRRLCSKYLLKSLKEERKKIDSRLN